MIRIMNNITMEINDITPSNYTVPTVMTFSNNIDPTVMIPSNSTDPFLLISLTNSSRNGSKTFEMVPFTMKYK